MRGLVLVAAALGAHGVRGEVAVRSFTGEPEDAFRYGPLLDENGRILLTPRRWRPLKAGFALTAPESTDRTHAEALRGAGLYAPRDAFPAPAEDEFYVVDLIGCRVEGPDGALLGEIAAVHDFGAGDILEVRAPDGESLHLPFTKAVIPEVDLPARIVRAIPPRLDQTD